MASQITSPAPSNPSPAAAMFDTATVQKAENSDFSNVARDMVKIVINYHSSSSSAVPARASQATGNYREDENIIDHLSKTIALVLEEIGKNQPVGKPTGPDGTDQLPQAATTDHTSQSDTAEGYLADISDIVPPDPSSLPVTCIADRYARSMLKCLHGYPLYEPQPFSELSEEYLYHGVSIGDVGFVRGDGTFDFLFNICPSHDLINPSDLPADFYLTAFKHSATRAMTPLPHKTYIFGSSIARTISGKYTCKGSEGAILELPEGAIEHEAMNIGPFKKLAERLGVDWYEYTMTRGRDIPNGSLYLITSFTKCTQWGIAVFDRPCDLGQGLRFGSKFRFPFRNSTPKYHWKGSGAFTTKIAKHNQRMLNQCVFLRGYKIMIRQDIFDNLCNNQRRKFDMIGSSSSPQAGSSRRVPATRIRGGGGTDLMSKLLTRPRTKTPTWTQSDQVVLHANFNSSLVHPSDLINSALLSQNPGAKVALTHDDVWCDLLRDNFPKLNHASLINIARSYTSTIDEYGCVSLEKISDSSNDESSHSVRETETSAHQGLIQQNCPATPNEERTPVPAEIPLPSVQEKNDNVDQAILYEVHGDTVIFQFGDGYYTEQERDMIRDHLSNSITFRLLKVNQIMFSMKSHPLASSILNLPNPRATYNDYQDRKKYKKACINETGVALLREMADWVSGTDETKIYVLSGPAAIENSTIAYTIAAQADILGLLGASFFFSRDNADMSKMFFTAIAYQLCLYNEPFAKAIEAALIARPLSEATMKEPQEQLKALILEPLENIVQPRIRPILIVVDTFDDEDLISVLTGLRQLVQDLPPFKVILTIQPQPHVDHFFHNQDHRIFHVQDIKDGIIHEDPDLSLPQDRAEGGKADTSTFFAPPTSVESFIGRTDVPSIPFAQDFILTSENTFINPGIVSSHSNDDSYSNASTPSSSNVLIRPSQGLDNLQEFVSFSPLYDSSAQDLERCCHPGTRKNVLHKMCAWMDDPNSPQRILWLHDDGPTGVRKSAIAQTISKLYDQGKVEGTTFFFFGSDPIRNDGNRLFPTLAWQLASSLPIVKDHIAFSLERDPDLPRKAVEVQFEQLIAQPILKMFGGESAVLTSMPVMIIGGLDKCSDVQLQRRILRIIGRAVTNSHFPLRFIISSRPNAYIVDCFSRFEHRRPTLQIDIANLDNTYRDLTLQFARIAVEQQLDPKMWPGQDIIDTLASKSSEQFASIIIRYVGDEYGSAVLRLDFILGLKLSTGKSPFSNVDALYTNILQRQPDQNFWKEFLAVVIARSALSQKSLYEDDALLLCLEETQLHRKCQEISSIYDFFVGAHDQSFLNFLGDSSRSGEYHISKRQANRRYMELITDVLVKAAEKAMEQRNSHGRDHFQPRFARIIQKFPLKIELPLNDLEETLQPLLAIQDKLLQLPNMSVPWKPRACDECWTFYIIDDLFLQLHLARFREATVSQEPKYVGIRPLTAMEEKQDIPQLDLDTCLSLLLAELRSVELSLTVDMIGLVRAVIHFDPIETAMKVRSITDAQNLLDLVFCLNKNECFESWFGASAHNATRLVLAIYGRMPLLPRFSFLNSADLDGDPDHRAYQGKAVKIWKPDTSVWRDCFNAFMWGNLSHGSIVPYLGMCFKSCIVMVSPSPENKTLNKWRRSTNLSVSTIQATLFKVAKAIQYIHSLGIVLAYKFDANDVYVLDSTNHVKLQCPYFQPNDLCKGQFNYDRIGRNSTLENDILKFGRLFFKVLYNKGNHEEVTLNTRHSEPQVPDNVWQLMQWCCAEDPKERPTIDQVVQEMESWISLGQFT